MRLGCLLLALLLNSAPVVAWQAQPGTVSGKVVNSVTGQAVKKAVVTLRSGSGQNSYVTGSDQSGKFLFDNVQPDKYVATAQAEGYSGNMRTVGKPISVDAQQQVEDVEVRIAPFAAISGKVLDEDGQPLAEVNVSVMRYFYGQSGKRMSTIASAQTDDRGIYRIFDLQPGKYYLMAFTPRSASRIDMMTALPVTAAGPRNRQAIAVHSTVPEQGYVPVYYPGMAELSQAQLQEVQPGAEWTGADFKLRQSPAYHIRGRISGATARGGRGTIVRAQRCEQGDVPGPMMPSAVRVNQLPNASFDISGAIAGTYCLTAMEAGLGGTAARQTVTVKGADIDDVELAATASLTVIGTVIIDGTPPSHMPEINIGLSSASTPGTVQGSMKKDGSFQIQGVYPGAYFFFMPQLGQLYVKSIFYGSQDVTNGVISSVQPGAALNVTLGTDPGEIDGTVQPGNVEAGMPVLIAALPEDAYAARQDTQRLTRGSAGSAYTLSNVPPGNYRVFAISAQDFSDVENRDLMKLLEDKAASVTVHAAGHEQVSITAISSGELEQAMGKLK